MKRFFVLLLAAILCLGLITACGEEATEDLLPPNLLSLIAQANSKEGLLEWSPRVAAQYQFYYGDGTIASGYAYCDKYRCAVECPDGITMEDQGNVYGFDNDNKYIYSALFVGDSYAAFDESLHAYVTGFTYDTREEILSQVKVGNIIYVTTRMDEMPENFYESYGFTPKEGDSYKGYYQVDLQSKVILEMKFYLTRADGTQLQTLYMTRIQDPAYYEPSSVITNSVFSVEARLVTVMEVDENGHAAVLQTQRVGKGSVVEIFLPEGYDPLIYADAQCTRVLDKTRDLAKDCTVYIRREGQEIN